MSLGNAMWKIFKWYVFINVSVMIFYVLAKGM